MGGAPPSAPNALNVLTWTCPDGGIGRHTGLKIPRTRKGPCRFESGSGHQLLDNQRISAPVLQELKTGVCYFAHDCARTVPKPLTLLRCFQRHHV